MTKTAREVIEEHFSARASQESTDDLVAALAAAGFVIVQKGSLRQVENIVLERVAEAFSVGTSVTHALIHPQTVADRIRGFKHKDAP